MDNNKEYMERRSSGKVVAGLLLLTLGSVLLLDKLGFFFPRWLFSWPVWLIIIGLYTGSRHKFRNPISYILILIGVLGLADRILPGINIGSLIWPIFIIAFGLYMILGRHKKNSIKQQWKANFRKSGEDFDWDKRQYDETTGAPEKAYTEFDAEPKPDNSTYGADFLDSVSVFGGVKKNIVSKNFQGGDVVNFMGGAEINLTQADIHGRVILDVTQVFGGTKIIVPPHWMVHSEMAAIFGGIEDKRPVQSSTSDSGKVLIIKGTSIFGGIDIRSY